MGEQAFIMVTVQQAAAARQIEQQAQLEQSDIRARLSQKFEQRNIQIQAEADKAYQKKLQQYVDEMSKQGFKPVYTNGQLSWDVPEFDKHGQPTGQRMSVSEQNIGKYIEDANLKIEAYNRLQEQVTQIPEVIPKWFDIKPTTSLLERMQQLIPAERLTYEVRKMIDTVETERQKAIQGKENTFSAKAANLLIKTGYQGLTLVPSTLQIIKHPVQTYEAVKEAAKAFTGFEAAKERYPTELAPQIGLIAATTALGVRAKAMSFTQALREDPYGTAGTAIGWYGTGILLSKAIGVGVRQLKTVGAGDKIVPKTILVSGQKVRVVDLVTPDGGVVRVLLQEAKYGASEKASVIAQLKYASEAKGMKFFTHTAPKPIPTKAFEPGKYGFDLGDLQARGLYFAPESIITKPGVPQIYTYYGRLSGASREISYPRYLWEKYVQRARVAKAPSRAVTYVLERDFPNMPSWMKEVYVKQAKSLSSSSYKSVNYWSKLFDKENLGKIFKFKDDRGVIHTLTPDGFIKSVIRNQHPTVLELKAAKATYYYNVKTQAGIIGGPEFITAPYGFEWQFIEPMGKAFQVEMGLRQKILRKVGIERGLGYIKLDKDIIDINFLKQMIPIKEKLVKVVKVKKTPIPSPMDTLTDSLIGTVRRPELVRVRAPGIIPRVPIARINDLLVGREGRELARREVERALRRPMKRPTPERPRGVQRARERYSLIPERVPPARPTKERPRPERPRFPELRAPRPPMRPPRRPPRQTFTLMPPPLIPRPRPKRQVIKKVGKKKEIRKKKGYRIKPTVTQEVYGFKLPRGVELTGAELSGFELARV